MERTEVIAALDAVEKRLFEIRQALMPATGDASLTDWLEACCLTGNPNAFVRSSDAYASYQAFGGLMGLKAFSHDLGARPGIRRKRVTTGTRFVGLALK